MKEEKVMRVFTTGENQKGEKRRVEVEYEFGTDLEDMKNIFGSDSVFYNTRASMVISLQAAIRNWVKKGLKDNEIISAMKTWEMPDKRPSSVSRLDRASKVVDQLSDSERKALLSKLLSTND